jgi:hypothetical protein
VRPPSFVFFEVLLTYLRLLEMHFHGHPYSIEKIKVPNVPKTAI